jgi:hypothetical protein
LNATYLGHGSSKGEIGLAYLSLPSNSPGAYVIDSAVVVAVIVVVVFAVLLWLKKKNR